MAIFTGKTCNKASDSNLYLVCYAECYIEPLNLAVKKKKKNSQLCNKALSNGLVGIESS